MERMHRLVLVVVILLFVALALVFFIISGVREHWISNENNAFPYAFVPLIVAATCGWLWIWQAGARARHPLLKGSSRAISALGLLFEALLLAMVDSLFAWHGNF